MKDTTVRGGIVYDTSLICGDPNGVCIRNYIPIRKATITDYCYAELDENIIRVHTEKAADGDGRK